MSKNRSKKFAEFLYKRLENMSKKPDRILRDSSVREALQALEPTGDTQNRQKEYVVKSCRYAVSLWLEDLFCLSYCG